MVLLLLDPAFLVFVVSYRAASVAAISRFLRPKALANQPRINKPGKENENIQKEKGNSSTDFFGRPEIVTSAKCDPMPHWNSVSRREEELPEKSS